MSRKSIRTNIAYDTQRRRFYVTFRSRLPEGGPTQRYTRCYPSLQLAIQALDSHNAMRVLSKGGKGIQELTLGQWLRYWLEQVVQPACTDSTVHGYTMIVRNHLAPCLGHLRLQELTGAQVQGYLNTKVTEGLSPNTVRKHYGVLHIALECAKRYELLDRNVVDQVIPPATNQPEHHFYDSETMNKLFSILAGTSMEPVVKLAGYLGLRRSEICALKWSNVDLENKVVTIAEARTAVNGRPVDKGTKNDSSARRLGYRGLPDLEEMMERLLRQRKEHMARLGPAYHDQGYVVCRPDGRPYQPDYLSNRLQYLLRETELPYVTLHGLRHSFTSIAHSRNVPLFSISKALGHSTTNTTTRVYMHLFDETHLSVVQEVGKAISCDP